MPDKGRFDVWPGCLLSTGLMALPLYREARASHPPVVYKVVKNGIVVLCYCLAYKWIQAHPHVFLDECHRKSQLTWEARWAWSREIPRVTMILTTKATWLATANVVECDRWKAKAPTTPTRRAC